MPSWQRRRCGDSDTWYQVTAYEAGVGVSGERLVLVFPREEERSCSCPKACPAPRRRAELELRLVTGGGYLVGSELVLRREEARE